MPHLVVTEALLLNIFARVLRIIQNYAMRHIYIASLIPRAELGRHTWARQQQLQEQRYPFIAACAVFSWYSCQLFGICNVHTHYNTYD